VVVRVLDRTGRILAVFNSVHYPWMSGNYASAGSFTSAGGVQGFDAFSDPQEAREWLIGISSLANANAYAATVGESVLLNCMVPK